MGNPGVGNWLTYKDDEVSSLLQCAMCVALRRIFGT